MSDDIAGISPGRFREVLGQYPTGVAVIAATGDDGVPIGMVVGSFGSVSLNPPLVAFMPDRKSSSWQKLREHETYCVNVLGAHQIDVCRDLASKRPDKFANIAWSPSARGCPVIVGSTARIECVREAVHEAGDHLIVVARVVDLEIGDSGAPLLFYRGGYGTFSARSMVSGDAEILERLRLLDCIRDTLEGLAAELDAEVTAVALIKNELCLIGSYGRSRTTDIPTRVGQRVPFMPPMGGVFAAWGSPTEREHWLSQCRAGEGADRGLCLDMIASIRARGYAIGFGHERSRRWSQAAYRLSTGDPEMSLGDMRRLIAEVFEDYNPGELRQDQRHEFHFAQAPVFDAGGEVITGITVWGPEGTIPLSLVAHHTRRLVDAAARATRRLGGVVPEQGVGGRRA